MGEQRQSSADVSAALHSILIRACEQGIPGISAAIARSHNTIWHSSRGFVDIQAQVPVEIKHSFGIGSITKVFVAVVILQLVDETKLRLENTLKDLLAPSIYEGIENAAEATIASLLSHTAGIDSWEDDPKWIVRGRGRDLLPGKIWDKVETLEYVKRSNPSGPTPGVWSYSHTGFTLLGLVIEKITQQPAEMEIRRRILQPLKMSHTYLEGFEEARPQTSSHRYHWDTAEFRRVAGICPSFSQPRQGLIDATGSNLSVEWTAGGLVSPPSDLLSFAIALRDGRLLSRSSLEFMKIWQPVTDSAEMGHGLFRFRGPTESSDKWIGHFGDVLGFSGALLWKEQGNCAVCILANIGTMHAGKVPSSASILVRSSEFLRLASSLALEGEPDP